MPTTTTLHETATGRPLALRRSANRSARRTLTRCAANAALPVLTALLMGSAKVQAQGVTAPPTDAQIAHIAVTADRIDIDAGRVAKSKSRNADVVRFAETMIRDHTSVNERATALVKELGVTPEENEVSRSLLKDAADAKAELDGLSGAAFDRAYIDREVGYHQAVIDALGGVLIPNARNARLKELLEKVLPAFEGHLRMAKDVQAKLKGI